MDLLTYIEGVRRTRSYAQIDKNPVLPELDGCFMSDADREWIRNDVREALVIQNAAANAAFGLMSEVYEFIDLSDRQSWFRLDDEEQLVGELGDCWYYAATLIDVLPMEMTLVERVDMFFEYYNDLFVEIDFSLADHWLNIGAMGKKIVAHGINPNAEYKGTGLTFNEIFMRHLAELMWGLLSEINVYLKDEHQYTLAEIWQTNLTKLEKRHPTGFDGQYNYIKPEVQELELFPCVQVESISDSIGEVTKI